MNEDNFSLTSFVFWPYHSWIDAQIEIYVRRANAAPDGKPFQTLKNKLIKNVAAPVNGVLKEVIHNISSFVEKQQSWKISGPETLSSSAVGYYPILEYMTPRFKAGWSNEVQKLEASFNARDFVVTDKQIRTSF